MFEEEKGTDVYCYNGHHKKEDNRTYQKENFQTAVINSQDYSMSTTVEI